MTTVKRYASIAIGLAMSIAWAAPAYAHTEEHPRDQAEHLVRRANYRIGMDYCWGGTHGCFDCSGLTLRVFYEHGARLPHSTTRQWRARNRPGWRTIENRSYLRPGDLVFFRNTYKRGISHVGVYTGDQTFVHAGDRVTRDSLRERYWRRHFAAGVRPLSLRFVG